MTQQLSEKNTRKDLSELRPIFAKLPVRNIVLLKSLFESYEGVAELRTLDNRSGEVVLLALEASHDDALALLKSLGEELEVRIIPKPENIEGDWLLSEELSAAK